MGLPSQKRSKSYKRKRALQYALKKVRFSICPKCSKKILPHHACSFCGTYKGREILKLKHLKDKTKKEKKSK